MSYNRFFMLTPDLKTLQTNKALCTEKSVNLRYPEFSQFLKNQYPNFPHLDRLYRFYYNIDTPPTCPVCGKELRVRSLFKGYPKYCCSKCANSDPNKIELTAQNNIKKFGVRFPSQSEVYRRKQRNVCMEKYGSEYYSQTIEGRNRMRNVWANFTSEDRERISNRKKETCRVRYGGDAPLSSEAIKEKTRETCLRKYGTSSVLSNKDIQEKIKRTNLERYGVENAMMNEKISKKSSASLSTKEVQQKMYNTKKKNHTFNTSKIEREFKQWLDEHNINYKYQYKSDQYPFVCDFYFPDRDLYLEIQGSWTHGFHPFNKNSEEDKRILQHWKEKSTQGSKFYDTAIKVWTESDPKKRNYAKKHHINLIELFTNDTKNLSLQFITHCKSKSLITS